MKISDPIFPIEMDLAKRGINVKSCGNFLYKWNGEKVLFFRVLEVGDGFETFSNYNEPRALEGLETIAASINTLKYS